MFRAFLNNEGTEGGRFLAFLDIKKRKVGVLRISVSYERGAPVGSGCIPDAQR